MDRKRCVKGAFNGSENNGTDCIDDEDLQFNDRLIQIHIMGYTSSVIPLIIWLFLFCYFKRRERCMRTEINKHLCISIIISNVLLYVWYAVKYNEILCMILQIAIMYHGMSSYFSLIFLGIYLHGALHLVFVDNGVAITRLYLISWGLPAVISMMYTSVRFVYHAYYFPDQTNSCKEDEYKMFWIVLAPVLISLVVSMGLLINIVRILVKKIRERYQDCLVQALKCAKASMILTLLFVLHLALIPFQPSLRPRDLWASHLWQIIAAVVSSFQGIWVSLFFCCTNPDIISACKSRLMRTFRRNPEVIEMADIRGRDNVIRRHDDD